MILMPDAITMVIITARGMIADIMVKVMNAATIMEIALIEDTCMKSVASAAAGMNRMKQEILFYKRAYEDSSQNALWHYMVEYFYRRYTDLAKETVVQMMFHSMPENLRKIFF